LNQSTGSAATSAGGCNANQPTQILGVELSDESIRLADLPAARTRTVVVLGNESDGIPPEAMDMLDVAVEIPMIGTGDSLNVAVAGSLVLYTLAGVPLPDPRQRRTHAGRLLRGVTVCG